MIGNVTSSISVKILKDTNLQHHGVLSALLPVKIKYLELL